MDDNPYQAPSSRVEDVPADEQQLANRGLRLGAALLDTLILVVVLIPLQFVGGYWQMVMEAARAGERVPTSAVMMWSLIGVAVFIAIQGYPLITSAQTWGKKICSMRIVNLDGARASLPQLGIRYAVYMLVGIIPIVGIIGSLVNVLLIFREDHRCGHDLAAGTRVVMT